MEITNSAYAIHQSGIVNNLQSCLPRKRLYARKSPPQRKGKQGTYIDPNGTKGQLANIQSYEKEVDKQRLEL